MNNHYLANTNNIKRQFANNFFDSLLDNNLTPYQLASISDVINYQLATSDQHIQQFGHISIYKQTQQK